jgi:CPA1 family monovalent cation:H+ antiporter
MLEIPAILFNCVAIFGYINYRYLKLPLTVGLAIIALLSTMLIILVDNFYPHLGIVNILRQFLDNIDFNRTLMEGMLCFLLFAGALHINLDDLLKSKFQVGALASIGVLISSMINGLGFYGLTQFFGFDVGIITCFLFGVIVSPTDPVAVMSVLKRIKIPVPLKTTIAGESLFNDGFVVVLYSILVTTIFGDSANQHESMSVANVIGIFIHEAFGGVILGLIAGYLTFLLLKSIDDYIVEIITTLALVTGAYTLSLYIHVSGPIAMVVSGILIGNTGMRLAMSESTKIHVTSFWHLIDEILNAVLFVLIGFEIIMLSNEKEVLLISLFAILVSLCGRWLAVFIPIKCLNIISKKEKGTISILTWAGLRGGISVALALALPINVDKPIILTATYAVVLFTILIQGLSIEYLIKYVYKERQDTI